MSTATLIALAAQSVNRPRQAARYLLSLDLPREALLLAFALVVIGNTIAFGLSLMSAPIGAVPMGVLISPVGFLLMQAVVLGASILALTLAGRPLGGGARLRDVALLVIWLQALRVAVQFLLVVLWLAVPQLAALVVFAAMALGIWISVNFIDIAHGFESVFKSLAVLIFGMVGMVLAMTLLLTLLGVTPNGMTGYV
jgi:hypothetical protein